MSRHCADLFSDRIALLDRITHPVSILEMNGDIKGFTIRLKDDISRDLIRAFILITIDGSPKPPDLVPVISEVESLPGYIIAAGFSGHGFAIGPGAGRLVSDIITGSTPLTDITPYRLGRFLDGSKIRRPEMM